MCGTSIGYSTLLTMFVQEVVNLTLDNDMGSQQGKKGLMWLMLESCQCCIDWGEPCKEPPAGSKGTMCKKEVHKWRGQRGGGGGGGSGVEEEAMTGGGHPGPGAVVSGHQAPARQCHMGTDRADVQPPQHHRA